MRLAGVRPQPHCVLDGASNQCPSSGAVVEVKKIKKTVRPGHLTISGKERRVARDGLIKQIDSLQDGGFYNGAKAHAQEQGFGAGVKVKGGNVTSRPLLDRGFFGWGKFRLELVRDGLCNLALDGKYIGQIAIVSLRPKMCVRPRIDQLGVDADTIGRALDTSFEEMRDTKSLADLTQVALDSGLVLHNRSAADDLQVCDSGEVG